MSSNVSIGGLPKISETDRLDIRGGTSGVRVRSNDDSTITLTLDNTGALTIPGALVAASVAGSAASLTSIPAGNLTGTVPNNTLPTTLPSVTSIGSVTGLTVATGTPVKGITKYAQALSPVAVAANTTAEQSLTVTGITATDVVIAFVKPTAQAGLAVGTVRVTGSNTVAVTFINDTAGIITPTAAETYTVVALTF